MRPTNFFELRRLELFVKVGRHFTRRFIGEQLGVTPHAVGMWERGQSAPRLHMVSKLAKVYRVSESKIKDAIFQISAETTAA